MTKCLICSVSDIRPSLLFSHSLKLKHELMKKKLKSDPKPKTYYRDLENQLREEAMNRPLDQTNKGFKMLTKMGFKGYENNSSEGKTSETDTQTSSGQKRFSSEPIKIQLKSDRKGLGTEPKRQKTVRKEDKIDDRLTTDQFLSHKKSRNQLFLIEKDLKTAQKVCRNLDIDSGFDENQFQNQSVRPKWFWPPIEVHTNDDNDSKNDEEVEEEEEEDNECIESKLKSINEYLRDKYFYCIWCGIRFNDSQDLSDNCLGDTRDDHQ